jgi:hypothetical protein
MNFYKIKKHNQSFKQKFCKMKKTTTLLLAIIAVQTLVMAQAPAVTPSLAKPKFTVPNTGKIKFYDMPKLGNGAPEAPCVPLNYKTQTKPNILINSDFAIQLAGYNCPQTFTNTISNDGAGGGTCVENWVTWGFSTSMPSTYTLTTNILPSTCPYGAGKMLHVKQSANGAGIANQRFTENPAKAVASVWVYVVKGTIGLGIGNGGNTSNTVWTCQTGVWTYLETCNLDNQSPVTNFIMYNKNSGSEEAEFYVANPRVTKL